MTAVNPDGPMVVRGMSTSGFLRVNRLFIEQVGYTAAELQTKPLVDWIEPSDRARIQQILEHGAGSAVACHRTSQGGWIEFSWNVRRENDELVILGLLQSECEPECKHVSESPAPVPKSMHETLAAMARIIETERPGRKCSILLLDETGRHVTVGAGPSLPDEYNRAVEGLMIGSHVGSCGTAAYWNTRVIVEDIQNDPLWQDLKDHAARAGVAACWSQPVVSESGRVLGATALYCSEPCAPTQQELAGLASAASLFALAIERNQAEQTLADSQRVHMHREAELENQLLQAAKMEALGVLAGGLAHDFNNMLATILGNTELAMDALSESGDGHTMLQNIKSASQNAADLCGQMLAFAGSGVISKQKLELNSVITELGSLLHVAVSRKATLEYQLCDEPIFVHADKAQLTQVVMNLITNAAESLGNEAGRITATTGIQEIQPADLPRMRSDDTLGPGRYIALTVSDTGCGMNVETQARIFDPFFTTKFTGRGLGMAAVRGIIQRHHGHVSIASEVGVGTTFTVLLPQADASQMSPEQTADGDSGTPASVLVVDDEPSVRDTVERLLLSAGFRVITAENGVEAVDVYRRSHELIDCVLLDLSMPHLDGEETFQELKKIQPNVSVVLSSGYAQRDVLNRIDGQGFSGVLQKPVSRAALVEAVNEAVQRNATVADDADSSAHAS